MPLVLANQGHLVFCNQFCFAERSSSKEIEKIMRDKAANGVLCAFLGATFWGLSGVCADFLFSNYEASPLFVTMTRTLGAGAMFLVVILLCHGAVLNEMLSDGRIVMSLIIFGCFLVRLSIYWRLI